MDFKNLSTENAELANSLRELGITDEEIAKSLNIDEGSIDEQIATKTAELEKLNKLRKSETFDIGSEIITNFDEIKKSFTEQITESNEKFEDRFGAMTDLMKSLTSSITSLSDENKQLLSDNIDLKKSLGDTSEILNKLASFTPGLRSLSGASPAPRFEKSNTSENVLSISFNKEEILGKLTSKMDNAEFAKSLGNDVSSFEVSGRMTPRLEKAIKDEFGIELSQ